MLEISFGTKIKELRNSKKLSQQELSNITGIERAQISKIEKGRINVTLETMQRLSLALDINLKELLDFEFETKPKPFVKWAGGKTQILDKIKELMPKKYNKYFEPFIGGGALFFDIQPHNAYINDNNLELINAYKCFENDEDYFNLMLELKKMEKEHSEDFYYEVRVMDRDDSFLKEPIFKRASRLIYLNKSCFNGLYRVNSKGFFNVPSGKKEKINTFDINNFKNIRDYFSNNKIHILNCDFEEAIKNASKDDFVYFDPPYDIFPDKNGFVDYGKDGFDKKQQIRLRDCFKRLSNKGVKVMLSNHNTPFINDIYSGFNIHIIQAKRMINSNVKGRGNVEEVIITNY